MSSITHSFDLRSRRTHNHPREEIEELLGNFREDADKKDRAKE